MAQTVKSRVEAAAKKLRRYGQEHLLGFVDELDKEQKLQLLGDIEGLDFELIED